MTETTIHTSEMSATEMRGICEALISRQEEIIGHLSKHRAAEVRSKSRLDKASIELGEAEDDMARLHKAKSYEILTSPEWISQKADPTSPTGETSKEWGELVIERILRGDTEWNETLRRFYDKQKEAAEIKAEALKDQAAVLEFQEVLMSINQTMRLRAAQFQANERTEIRINEPK